MTFGEKLYEILENKELSQKEFAKMMNVSPSTLNCYIKDKRQPDIETLKIIASKLNVSLDFLLDYDNSKTALTVKELSLISKIRKMNNSQKEIIYDLVNIINQKGI